MLRNIGCRVGWVKAYEECVSSLSPVAVENSYEQPIPSPYPHSYQIHPLPLRGSVSLSFTPIVALPHLLQPPPPPTTLI